MVAKGVKALVVFPDAARRSCRADELVQGRCDHGSLSRNPGGKAGVNYNVFTTPTSPRRGTVGKWILRCCEGRQRSHDQRPQGNSQGVQENQGLHKILDSTHKYTFIGAKPFEVTNWDPALTQKGALGGYRQVPEDRRHRVGLRSVARRRSARVQKSGRTIRHWRPRRQRARLLWKKNHAANPTFKR